MLNTTPPKSKLIEKTTGSGVYAKQDVQIITGEGAAVWDESGKRYIDCVSGQGASNLGHAHPALMEAMRAQMDSLLVCPELFHNPVRAQYQDALCEVTGMSRVFLCTSGTEAVEGALKFAHLHTKRKRIISMTDAYHGRTVGALGVTWDQKIREPFHDLLPDVVYVPLNDLETLREALDETIAAVIVEPIQGYGGVRNANAQYLRDVQSLCDENGSVFIVDEVQTGFGRTGVLFAYQEMGLSPDIVCLAKSIAGGLPVGAVLLHERLGEMPTSSHGSTFGGHPLGCSVGLAVLDVLQNTDLIPRARELGEEVINYFRQNLPDDVVVEVRGQGFLIGIELDRPVGSILNTLLERGVLAMSAGPNVIRLLPPLVITDEDMWQVVSIIEQTINEL